MLGATKPLGEVHGLFVYIAGERSRVDWGDFTPPPPQHELQWANVLAHYGGDDEHVRARFDAAVAELRSRD